MKLASRRRMHRLASLFFGLAMAALIVGACGGDDSTSAGAADGGDAGGDAAQGIGFGCCPLNGPPTCASQGRSAGGTKQAATNGCVGTYDAVEDPSAPGWKIGNDANGCPTWLAPAGAALISCIPLIDSGA